MGNLLKGIRHDTERRGILWVKAFKALTTNAHGYHMVPKDTFARLKIGDHSRHKADKGLMSDLRNFSI